MADVVPDHIQRPHLRPIQPVPVEKDGRRLVALHDPSQLREPTMIVAVQTMPILQAFQGERTLEEIAASASVEVERLTELVVGLDRFGLLWGPTFEKLEAERFDALKAAGSFPVRASAMLGDDADACRRQLDEWFGETEDPELDAAILGIVAPHLDYARGWPNYAAAYYGLRGTEAPDRVVVLGTNHFGIGDGVVVTELGFESPLGRCPADEAVTARLVERFGRSLVVDQLDHMGEHSIELQLPWLQHCFGDVPIVAALVPDPLREMIADDEGRVPGPVFIEALREVLDDAGGRTLYVASADLSHVGPQFGEPRPVDDQRRVDVEQHDRDMMSRYVTGDAEEFLGAMKWSRNPTSWCSVGNMAALLQLTDPETVDLIDYRQAYDEKGVALVSSAAIALTS